MNILRRLPLYRLLLLCGVMLAVGVGATALAFALGAGPTPPPKPLAQAVHDALSGAAPEGFSANVQLTDHLLEGANLASEGAGAGGGGGELTSSPLVEGGSGRLWIAKDGEFRLELQSEQGDTEIVYDGHTLELYDAATNTLYRYSPPAPSEAGEGSSTYTPMPGASNTNGHEAPSVAKIEEAIAHLSKHADLSGAVPTDVAGQAAYSVRLSPQESGSLFGAVELSFDASNGVPLRAAVYSSSSSAPVLELATSEVSFGPVESSIFTLNVPASAKLQEAKTPRHAHARRGDRRPHRAGGQAPKVTVHGHGPAAIAVLEAKASGKSSESEALRGLPQVNVNATKASELRTALGTLLTFEQGGIRYVLAGSVEPGALQALASGL